MQNTERALPDGESMDRAVTEWTDVLFKAFFHFCNRRSTPLVRLPVVDGVEVRCDLDLLTDCTADFNRDYKRGYRKQETPCKNCAVIRGSERIIVGSQWPRIVWFRVIQRRQQSTRQFNKENLQAS